METSNLTFQCCTICNAAHATHTHQESGSHAGHDAIEFFESTNPEVPRFGCGAGIADNMAEWIVDLTTKVWLVQLSIPLP